MQRCQNCGLLNDDSEDFCEFCGEALFIQVEHEDGNGTRYADDIFEELSQSNSAAGSDSIDDFARELLEEEEHQEEYYTGRDIYEKDDDIFEEDIADDDDNTGELFFREKSDFELRIEEELKKFFKRNKKLEKHLNLDMQNIQLDYNDNINTLAITADVKLIKHLTIGVIRLSAIVYDTLGSKYSEDNIFLEDITTDSYDLVTFNVNIDLNNISRIIIIPELTSKRRKEQTPRKEVEKRPQYQPARKPKTQSIAQTPSNVISRYENIYIEQREDIEHRIGMKITNTSVLVRPDNLIEIVGEIYIKNPDKYDLINIVATCYDHENNILATESKQINTKLYLGFDTLSLKLDYVDVDNIERILLYPTLQ